MKRIIIKPTNDTFLVRDPKTKVPLPKDGKSVPNISFWRRRLKDGSVMKVPRPEKLKVKNFKKENLIKEK